MSATDKGAESGQKPSSEGSSDFPDLPADVNTKSPVTASAVEGIQESTPVAAQIVVLTDAELEPYITRYNAFVRAMSRADQPNGAVPAGTLYKLPDGQFCFGLPSNWFEDEVLAPVVGGITVALNKRKIFTAKAIEKIPLNTREPKCMPILIGLIEGLDWEPTPKSKIPARVHSFDAAKPFAMAKMGIIYRRLVAHVGRNPMHDMNMLDRDQMYFGNDPLNKDKVTLLKKLLIPLTDVKTITRLVEIFTKLATLFPLRNVDETDLVNKMCKPYDSWTAQFARTTLKRTGKMVRVKGKLVPEEVSLVVRPEKPSKGVLLLDAEEYFFRVLANQHWESSGYRPDDYQSTIVSLGSIAFEARLANIYKMRWTIVDLFCKFVGSRTAWFNKQLGAERKSKAEINTDLRARIFTKAPDELAGQLVRFLISSTGMELYLPALTEAFGAEHGKALPAHIKENIAALLAKKAYRVAKIAADSETRRIADIAKLAFGMIANVTDALLMIKSVNWAKLYRGIDLRSIDQLSQVPDLNLRRGVIIENCRALKAWLFEYKSQRRELDKSVCATAYFGLVQNVWTNVRSLFIKELGVKHMLSLFHLGSDAPTIVERTIIADIHFHLVLTLEEESSLDVISAQVPLKPEETKALMIPPQGGGETPSK
jgi:hypothetical protein